MTRDQMYAATRLALGSGDNAVELTDPQLGTLYDFVYNEVMRAVNRMMGLSGFDDYEVTTIAVTNGITADIAAGTTYPKVILEVYVDLDNGGGYSRAKEYQGSFAEQDNNSRTANHHTVRYRWVGSHFEVAPYGDSSLRYVYLPAPLGAFNSALIDQDNPTYLRDEGEMFFSLYAAARQRDIEGAQAEADRLRALAMNVLQVNDTAHSEL